MEIECNMKFVTLNVLAYISGIIDSITYPQNDILTDLLPLYIYKLR